MISCIVSAALLALVPCADALQRRELKTMPMHMQRKITMHLARRDFGVFEGDEVLLEGGGSFPCDDEAQMSEPGYSCYKMDLKSFVSNADMGSLSIDLVGFDYVNDLWGYTSKKGKEYAIVGLFDGTAFVDICDPAEPIVLGFLPTSGNQPPGDFSGFWRDMKVVNDVVYISAEVAEHGIQIFDLTRLDDLEPSPPGETRENVTRLEADGYIGTIGSAHNIIQFPEMDMLLVVGMGEGDTTVCNVTDGETVAILHVGEYPLDPEISCITAKESFNNPGMSYDGYVHDGQCIIYHGPDEHYYGDPICVFFAETEIGIYDMSMHVKRKKRYSKAGKAKKSKSSKSRRLSGHGSPWLTIFTYPGWAYVHQGWFSEDHKILYGNDELDEEENTLENGQFPTTRIFDMSILDSADPPLTTFVNTNAHPSIDHNLYIKDWLIYSANYEAGSRVYEIQDDYSLVEVAYFDVSNDCDDIDNCADPFGGSWTHYPYYKSGTTIGCSGYYGLFVFDVRV